MEKIKVQICDRTYNLMSEDGAGRIQELARGLENQIIEYTKSLKNRSECEILTLVALNVLDECQKENAGYAKELKALKEKMEILNSEKTEMEERLHSTLAENVTSAGQEMEQIAAIKDMEKEELQKKLLEYETTFEKLVEQRESEIKNLKDGYSSAYSEMEHIAFVKDTDNEKLRTALNNYERTFDTYVKTKEDEITRLKSELESKQIECDDLRQRLAALNDEGQLTIC